MDVNLPDRLKTPEQIAAYYANLQVKSRMSEYIAHARYICTHSPGAGGAFLPRPPGQLEELLLQGTEIHRSLWDDSGLLVLLDLEYVLFQDPQRAYRNPTHGFEAQSPVVEHLGRTLERYGIPYLQLVTGRGHHLCWMVGRESQAFEKLSQLGKLSPSLLALYDQPHRPLGKRVSRAKAAAFSGLGMVLEYLGHQMLEKCRFNSIPLRLAAIEPAGGPQQEILCLDLSAFGDPLHRRSERLPFSLYRKGEACGYHDPIVCLPRAGLDLPGILKLRGNLAECAAWAQQSDTRIPQADLGMMALLEDYEKSDLAVFHQEFYRQQEQPRVHPAAAVDRLPHCVLSSLTQPNDLLLKPAALQNLVRCLLAEGWRSPEVARLVTTRLQQDHGWLPAIHFHEAGCRAEFYTRLFGGLLEAGHDRLEDLDCESTRAKGYCTQENCGVQLRQMANRWLRRHRYD